MINNLVLFQISVLLFLGGALLGILSRNHRFSRYAIFIPSIIGSVLTMVFSIGIILGKSMTWMIPNAVPFFDLDIFVDGVSAFFLLIIGLVSFVVSIYSIGYSKEYQIKKRTVALGFLFNVFILSMILVVSSNNAFFFLLFWEAMSLTSFFLVIYDHEKEENLKSGFTYLVMTHLGTAFIFASFLLGYIQTGSFSFDSFRHDSTAFPLIVKNLVFVFALIGFGTKAGMVPLHVWLPKAHPSAPSNVSSLMSAVMIKIGIYGMIRTIFGFSGFSSTPDFAWWGMLLVAFGSASAIVGVLYAVVERDIKRALAFSSIENIGIILTGLGLSVVFSSFHLVAFSALALVASMYHVINHAVFKGLLFMGAGSVVSVTHTKNIEHLGGLAKKMPWTSLLFLIGAISISGLPPFNGFVSEWFTMQSLLSSYHIPSTMLQISIAFASLPFALTIGIAAATFVKLFGMTFLSKARSIQSIDIKEVPHTMIFAMSILAAICVLLGVVPYLGTSLISTAFHTSFQPSTPLDSISIPNNSGKSFASLSMSVVVIVLLSVSIAVFGFIRVLAGNTKTTKYSTWDCGFGSLNERMEYTPTSLSQPIRAVFKVFFRPHNLTEKKSFGENQYMIKTVKIETKIKNIFEDLLYTPIVSSFVFFFDNVRRLQTGKINAYLLYIMITLVLLLLFVRLSNHG